MTRPEPTPLLRQLGRVRRRLFLQGLVDCFAGASSAALALGAMWFFAQPYLLHEPVASLRWVVFAGLAGAATLTAIVLALFRRPTPLTAALALDERFDLKERATTALTLAPEWATTPAAIALLDDVNGRVAPLHVGERFPVRPRRWALLVPALGLLLALVAMFWAPAFPSAPAAGDAPLAVEPVVKSDLERRKKDLQKKAHVRPAGEAPRSRELEHLESELDRLAKKPTETREQAREMVKDLTDAKQQAQKREDELRRRAEALKEQMRQLDRLTGKKPQDGPARRLEKAMDQAAFKQAREEAERLGRQLQVEEQADRLRKKMKLERLGDDEKKQAREQLERLEKQELKEGGRKQLEKQLGDIEDKLERLTRSDAARERLQELARRGQIDKEQLDRELDQLKDNLARIDPQTRQALAQLAQKLREARQALREGKNGEAAKKLKEAGERMEKLDGEGERKELAEQLRALEAARQAMCRALEGRDGKDGGEQQAAGKRVPGGPGGPASGARPESKDGETGAREEWTHSDLDRGRLDVIDHVPGDGFKGPRRPADMAEDVRRAAQEAPEAIDRQRLPRSASDMARGYFEKVRQAAGKE